ncbi:FG-GAP repeat domain-containing protein [Streptomyces exfoliatus]|uniref:FG-GAP repeat domain-containing protein n=1 Tax=Streptomyces exfoliatus TaxID=1905 RepID=UPI000464970F|nr:VCBS repeat-containing protein [Streptomyces exfoliatus]
MSHARTSRRHLTTAVAVALAAACVGTLTTAGTAAAALGATATTTASSSTAQEGVAALLPDSVVLGHGPTGFLTSHKDGVTGATVHRWTRYADGVSTALPAGAYQGGLGTDVIVKTEGSTYTLYDMATGAAPTVIDTSSLGATATLAALHGSTLVMRVPRAAGGVDLHLVGKPDGTLVDRVVTGIPTAAQNVEHLVTAPGTLLIRYAVPGQPASRAALVDTATARVVEDRVLTASDGTPVVTASATHLAWTEPYVWGRDSRALRVARRGQEESTRVPIGSSGRMVLGFLGDDWVTYADRDGIGPYGPDRLYALTAGSLTDGRTVKLLDLTFRILPGSDGELLVHGATLEHGEGLYRVTTGQDGTPATTLVASTGRPLALTVTGVSIPATVDLTTAGGDPLLSWQATGLCEGKVTIELTHTATGVRRTILTITRRGAGQTWDGLLDDGTAAPLGDYTWRLTTEPTNGIGPTTERKGTLKVVGKPAAHDFSNSTAPDLLFRSGGRLSVFDARQFLNSDSRDTLSEVVVGSGWDTYDRIVTPGNLGGTVHADLLGRDRSGVLWSYAGTGKPSAPFATRARVGGGWGIYNHLTAGLDVSGDGRRDLLATDKSGVLWLYKGTGSLTSPFRPRVKVGGGWGVYNKITATGNIGGGPAGDLIARDRNGVDWLYLGKGDGTFATRTRINSDWGYYTDLIPVGDADRDGRADLVVRHVTGGDTGSLSFHPGSGDWRNPFPETEGIDASRRFVHDGSLLF